MINMQKVTEKKTILITDDDVAHRTMLKVNLLQDGFEILEASDGDEVLPVLEEHDVDLILLDMKMERMDGLATLNLLSEKYSDLISAKYQHLLHQFPHQRPR